MNDSWKRCVPLIRRRPAAGRQNPGEKVNPYFQHPEIVRELKALRESSKTQGRSSAPSSPQ